MPLAITYNYNAVDCPDVRLPSGLLDPYNAAPESQVAVHEYITPGETTTGLEKHNRNTVRQEAQDRYGGSGSWCVAYGLGLKEHPTLANAGIIEIGQASLDGPVPNAADLEVPLSDNSRNFVWFSQTGDPIVKTTKAAPAEIATYVGSLKMVSGTITERDYSGRQESHQGVFVRRTGDVGPPGDTPPQTALFWQYTNGGFYIFYNGSYFAVLDAKTVKAHVADAGAGSLQEKMKATGGLVASIITEAGVDKLQISGSGLAPTPITLDQFYVDCPRGTAVVVGIDFSLKGAFSSKEFIIEVPEDQIDQLPPGVVVVMLASVGVSHGTLLIINAANSGSYYDAYSTYDRLSIQPVAWGFSWVAGAGGADARAVYPFMIPAASTGTNHIYNTVTIGVAGSYTLPEGYDCYYIITDLGAVLATLPVGIQHQEILIINLGSHVLEIAPGSGDTLNGSVFNQLMNNKYHCNKYIKRSTDWINTQITAT